MTDPYIVLGVKPDASDEEIKRAYRAQRAFRTDRLVDFRTYPEKRDCE